MKTCSDCQVCTGNECNPFRGDLRDYDGLRLTADGFDCALPVSLDTYSTCSYNCLYCFSNFLIRDPHRKGNYQVGKMRLSRLDRFLTLDPEMASREYKVYQDALRRPNGKRCPIQWGALGDPLDNIERWQGDALEVAKLMVKHKQPCRISTKGGLMILHDEYLDALSHPDIFWVAFSIISADDEVLSQIDINAPTATQRFAAMKALSDRGVKTSLRLRPIIPNVTDRTKNMKKAWKVLLDKAADAGAGAISMEYMFVPMVQPPHIKKRMKLLEDITGIPMTEFYKNTTVKKGSCLRSWKYWKEDMTFAIRDYSKKLGMTFGCSDPHWKELNDTGCCCGIQPDDPVFGNWERENACNALVEAQKKVDKGERAFVKFSDINPKWSKDASLVGMVCITKAKGALARKHFTWEMKLREQWNNVKGYRSPLYYFEDILWPTDQKDEEGNIIYEYKPATRKHKRFSWDVYEDAKEAVTV